jgi:hypothetical protein
MATIAKRLNLENAIKQRYVVAANNTVRQGMPVMLSTDEIVEADSDDDLYIGIAYESEDGVWPAGAGDAVVVILRGSPCVAPVRVAAAGCTKGAFVAPASGGVVDVTVGGGTVITNTVGQALETGVDGDLVGVNLCATPPTVTAS